MKNITLVLISAIVVLNYSCKHESPFPESKVVVLRTMETMVMAETMAIPQTRLFVSKVKFFHCFKALVQAKGATMQFCMLKD